MTKVAAVLVVLMFVGMIMAGVPGGSEQKVNVDNFALTEYNEGTGDGQLWIKLLNKGDTQETVSITLKLNERIINESEITISASSSKQVAYGFNFQLPSDKLVFIIEKDGKEISRYGMAVANYPQINPG